MLLLFWSCLTQSESRIQSVVTKSALNPCRSPPCTNPFFSPTRRGRTERSGCGPNCRCSIASSDQHQKPDCTGSPAHSVPNHADPSCRSLLSCFFFWIINASPPRHSLGTYTYGDRDLTWPLGKLNRNTETKASVKHPDQQTKLKQRQDPRPQGPDLRWALLELPSSAVVSGRGRST
jgi:hypothetical protein